MKKAILAALTATLVASPVAFSAADAQRHSTTVTERRNGTIITRTVDRGPRYRNWRRGERFDRRYAQNYQVVDYRRYRGLRAPPRGYRYVRSGNDALLIGITSGIIASVVTGAIR